MKNIWLLVLLSLFVLTVCFSIIRLTFAAVDFLETAGASLERTASTVDRAAREGDAGLTGILGDEGMRDIFKMLEDIYGADGPGF